MGCNSSKNQDIERNRRRIQNLDDVKSPYRSAPKGIDAPHRDDKQGGTGTGVYGTSLTDQRMEEQDFLRDLMETTQHRLIDLSMASNPNPNAIPDIVKRSHKYHERLSMLNLRETTTLFALPTAPAANANTAALLSLLQTPSLTAEEIAMATNFAQQAHQACHSLKIRDVGPVIVHLH